MLQKSSWSSKAHGLSLVELLVTLVIVGILASVALPYGETIHKREKEIELRRALRDVRTAIDQFHEDWREGRIATNESVASMDGYPVRLDVLVFGVTLMDGSPRKYLRRIPKDPFAEPSSEQGGWRLRGYREEQDSIEWDGKDVYDIVTTNSGVALDGTQYKDW